MNAGTRYSSTACTPPASALHPPAQQEVESGGFLTRQNQWVAKGWKHRDTVVLRSCRRHTQHSAHARASCEGRNPLSGKQSKTTFLRGGTSSNEVVYDLRDSLIVWQIRVITWTRPDADQRLVGFLPCTRHHCPSAGQGSNPMKNGMEMCLCCALLALQLSVGPWSPDRTIHLGSARCALRYVTA